MDRKIKTVCLVVACVTLVGCDPSLSSEIGKHGFLRVQPPRETLVPGNLVVIVPLPGGVVSVSPICWRRQAFGNLLDPRPNRAMQSILKAKVERAFTLEAEYLQRIKATPKYRTVSDISLSISNVTVPEYSDADLFEALKNRSAACQQAVRAREARKQHVLTVLQAMKADVVYRIHARSETGASAAVPAEVLEGLRLELGASIKNEVDSTVTGTALYWGLKPDIVAVASVPGGVSNSIVPLPGLTSTQRSTLTAQPALIESTESDADRIMRQQQ